MWVCSKCKQKYCQLIRDFSSLAFWKKQRLGFTRVTKCCLPCQGGESAWLSVLVWGLAGLQQVARCWWGWRLPRWRWPGEQAAALRPVEQWPAVFTSSVCLPGKQRPVSLCSRAPWPPPEPSLMGLSGLHLLWIQFWNAHYATEKLSPEARLLGKVWQYDPKLK